MATITAQANGLYSAGSTWVGGVPPGSSDVAALATFVVTVDQNVTVQAITHTSAAAKLLHASGAYTITVTAWQNNTVSASALIEVTGGTANLVGTFVGGTGNPDRYAIVIGSGAATITTVTGGAQSPALLVSGTGSVTVTTATGGSSTGAVGILMLGGTATVTTATGGTGSSGAYAVSVGATSTATIGTVNGGSVGTGVYVAGTATITNATGGSANSAVGVTVVSGGTVTITNVTGGSGNAGNYGLTVAAGGSATITNVTATAAAPGATSASTTARILGALTSGPNGRMPIDGAWLLDDAATVTLTAFNLANWPSAVGNPITLSVQGSSNPAADDVREGVTYGAGGALTGTLAVPDPASVYAGVPTDDTVGTGALVRDAFLEDLTTVIGAIVTQAATRGP